MEISNLIGKTIKKPPAGEYIDSFKLLIRGGFIKVLNDNSFVFTTLLSESNRNLSNLVLEHFYDFSVVSFFSRFSRDLVSEFLDSEVNSYKQLPLKLRYRFTKNHEINFLKLGLLYPHQSERMGFSIILRGKDELNITKEEIENRLIDFFRLLNLATQKFQSPSNNSSVNTKIVSEEISVLTDLGKHEYTICTSCDFKARRVMATMHKKVGVIELPQELTEVETPESSTIAHLAKFLEIPETKTAKVVFYSYTKNVVSKIALVIIRGDMEVNEFKIKQLLEVEKIKVATDKEIEEIGCVPGFASAIGINRNLCTVIVDDIIPKSINLVAGANKVNYHLLNTNYERDYEADIISDIAWVSEESLCSNCQSKLEIQFGIPLGHLTTNFREISITYTDEKGKPQSAASLNFEFDLTRILGALALDFDKFGIKFPVRISPFKIALMTIGSEPEVRELGDKLYEDLDLHFPILYDNRDVKLGVKLNDTDLRSIPFRIIISSNSLENNEIEFSKRGSKDKRYFKLDKALSELDKMTQLSLYKGL